jgi:predicted ArsR family transcriptional regulator
VSTTEPDPGATPVPADADLRVVSDARSMRALSHPLRLSLLELLGIEQQLTATEAGERLGETPAACSFHLRQLAKYGFVEEAQGGTGRARPWKLVTKGLSFSSVQPDREAAVAAGALARMYRERTFDRARQWQEASASFPEEWRLAATQSDFLVWLTAAELSELADELVSLVRQRFSERYADPGQRPAGALPVEVLMNAFPIAAPKEDDPS